MSILDLFRGRSPTNLKRGQSNSQNVMKMITTYGMNYYQYSGKLYDSDIVRACIRPKTKAVGKLSAKHLINLEEGGVRVNPEARIRFMLEEPNPYMTGQMLREKVTNLLSLNNNAFIWMRRDENGLPFELYPVVCTMAEAIYNEQGQLFLKFTYMNGKQTVFPYSDVIHLRDDYCENDVFGESPAPVLSQLMECVGVIDQGLVHAVKNSAVVRWLLSYNTTMRPEDIQKQTKAFVDDYLSYTSDTFGVAAIDQKVDAKQVTPTDYVPNAALADRITDRIYSFFNTNKDIVQSSYDEDQWNAYFQQVIEPLSIQFAETFTQRLFSRNERARGHEIVFESANLAYASMQTKLKLTDFVDRGMMNPNEVRRYMSLPAIEGGDVYVRRLDTAPVANDGGLETTPEQEEKIDAKKNPAEGGEENAENRNPRKDRAKRI